MKQWDLKLSFVTPAFVGDAEQKGAWRTPPFKALLRSWWRVAAADDCKYNVETLRARELALFGSAAGETGGKSKVRLRLGEWKPGHMHHLPADDRVFHKEVGRGGMKIGSMLYLGYGPIGYAQGKSVANMQHGIDAGEQSTLRIFAPASMERAVLLSAWFGTMGSRSRNGWGSLVMSGDGIASVEALLDGTGGLLSGCCRPLEECLRLDWPHAFGTDGKGALVWKSRQCFDSWEKAMKYLAGVKIAFRTALSIQNNQDAQNPLFEERHVLAYPVTNHGVDGWVEKKDGQYKTDRRGKLVQSERLANQIRFKVVKSKGKCYALVYHLPCDIPSELKRKLGGDAPSSDTQLQVWRKVHGVLNKKMQRLGGLA